MRIHPFFTHWHKEQLRLKLMHLKAVDFHWLYGSKHCYPDPDVQEANTEHFSKKHCFSGCFCKSSFLCKAIWILQTGLNLASTSKEQSVKCTVCRTQLGMETCLILFCQGRRKERRFVECKSPLVHFQHIRGAISSQPILKKKKKKRQPMINVLTWMSELYIQILPLSDCRAEGIWSKNPMVQDMIRKS